MDNCMLNQDASLFHLAKRTAGRSSLSVLISLAVGYIIVSVFGSVLKFLPIDPDSHTDANMIANMIGLDFIGIPLAYLFLRTLPRYQAERVPFRFKTFLLFLPCCFALGVAGALVSSLVSSFLPSGLNDNVAELLEGTSLSVSALSVVLAAPVMEELLFRKWIIDRLESYSPIGAVLFSAILFGLFHHNFSQLFYAFLLGFFLGAVYQRTHNILYTILLHAVFNSFSVLVTAVMPLGELLVSLFGMFEFSLAALGLVFLIVFRRKWFPERDEARCYGNGFYRSVFFYLFVLVCLVLSVVVEIVAASPTL